MDVKVMSLPGARAACSAIANPPSRPACAMFGTTWIVMFGICRRRQRW